MGCFDMAEIDALIIEMENKAKELDRAFNQNYVADLLKKAIQTIRDLQNQIPKWHLVADGDLPTNDIEECILVVNGKYQNITYHNAVVQNGEYYDGRFYINGVIKNGLDIIAWMELPKFEEVE